MKRIPVDLKKIASKHQQQKRRRAWIEDRFGPLQHHRTDTAQQPQQEQEPINQQEEDTARQGKFVKVFANKP